MYKRNLLKPGDYVLAMPVGLHLTLEYNQSGNLARVYTGFNLDRKDETSKLLIPLLSNETVPAKIHIVNGKTWITGVLYTGKMFSKSGALPQSIAASILEYYFKYPEQYNFFAATIESTSVPFTNGTQMRSTFAMDKFHMLPGWVVPANVSESAFDDWIYSDRFPFNDPIISDCVIFRKSDILFQSMELKQFTIDHIEKYVDPNGYIKARVYNTDNNNPIVYDFSDIVRMNLGSNVLLVVDSDNQPVHAKYIGMWKNSKRGKSITCTSCGKMFTIPEYGTVQCPDIHCKSRLFPKIVHFLSTMNMTIPNNNEILSWVHSNTVTCVPDVLILPVYSNMKIETTIADVLRSMVPIQLISNSELFTIFSSACNNNVSTVRYYTQYPDMIDSDLKIKHIDLNKFISWLHDPCNVSDLMTILDSPQIVLKSVNKKFDGAPIFRGKTICITGNFVHGDYSVISAILTSYSAMVTTTYTPDVDCVLVGNTQENVDGRIISSAREYDTTIMSESDFFGYYDIDTDIKNATMSN